ncbi:hypothetical protein AS850_03660 [Frondihabitans sp. 762G35]|uniref:MoaD/ThiS family protein n=1 Tax=Frondihabitans sp. 762G35 TaxID=1446794 RepID=UPI000D2190C7|nr:MoaD/ThiS family protein [Frondihabitans sp. 762G35]ARC56172.1 hypothetical protein AS850_03660 [Frondihabitans sp. 762G35]
MGVVTVTLRFFAAARAAAGTDQLECVAESEPTLGDLVETVQPAAGVDPDDFRATLERCSFLVDGVTTRDLAQVVPSGAVVDVMPPFAGG